MTAFQRSQAIWTLPRDWSGRGRPTPPLADRREDRARQRILAAAVIVGRERRRFLVAYRVRALPPQGSLRAPPLFHQRECSSVQIARPAGVTRQSLWLSPQGGFA